MRIVCFLNRPDLVPINMTGDDAELLGQLLPSSKVALCQRESDFLDYLPHADAVVVWSFRQEWFDLAPSLRYIATPAAGKDLFHVIPPLGTELIYGTFHGELIAETVLGMMLAFSRGIQASVRGQDKQPWARHEIGAGMFSLRNSKALILGFGAIGKHIGRLLKTIGIDVIGVNRTNLARPRYFTPDDQIVDMSGLDAALPIARHIILALPGGNETTKMLDARRISLLRRDAYVYNIGRGNAIDEEALYRALIEGRIAGAGLDVYAAEPLAVGSPLRRCQNVILMPHVSAMSPNYIELFVRELANRWRK